MISIKQAFEQWECEIVPLVIQHYGANDNDAMAQSWNDYTDSLCKDGELCDLQYNYCPAWDDAMPDCDIEHVIDCMGIVIVSQRITERPDGLMSDSASHWRVILAEPVQKDMTLFYSMGSAHTGEPELLDVLNCLLMDWQSVQGVDGFEEWADELGYDTDSRQAERIYNACKRQTKELEGFFTSNQLEQLSELFSDY